MASAAPVQGQACMILLVGGSSFLGSEILRRLLDQRFPTRVFTRGAEDWKKSAITNLRQKGVEVAMGDLTDKESIARGVEGCNAIINAAGTMKWAKNVNIREVNLESVQVLVEQAQVRGIQRFIHVSCLGASESIQSEYLRTKWEAEECVQGGKFYWTVFRPSYLFSTHKFPLMDLLVPFIKFRPLMPIIGTGVNEIQPIFVEDVADCVVQSLYAKHTVGRRYELGGPVTYSMSELMELGRETLGIRGGSINIPSDQADKTLSIIKKVLPNVNPDLVNLLIADSRTDEDIDPQFEISDLLLEDAMPEIMKHY